MISEDNPARNGVIHILDSLLFLPEKSLYESVLTDKRLQMFMRAALQTGSDKYLKGTDRLTVFAPSDNAFNSLPQGMLARLLLRPDQMEEFIHHHIHKGTVYISLLGNGDYGVMPLRGKILRVNIQRPKAATINLDAVVLVQDIKTTNGVLHIIDKVLLP